MLKVVFKVDSSAAVAFLRGKGPHILDVLLTRIDMWMIRLQAKIAGEKLQGEVLQHRTGTLAGSIHAIPVKVEGTIIKGEVQGAGGPAWYGKVHEHGEGAHGSMGTWVVPVNKKALRFMIGGKAVFAKRVLRKPLPQRSFMLSTIVEESERIVADLGRTVVQAAED